MMKFDEWLKTVCFDEPTPEAYDLARQAWDAGRLSGIQAGIDGTLDGVELMKLKSPSGFSH